MALSLPVVGSLTNKILTGRLLRTLGHLLESHVPLTDALDVARSTLGNQFYTALIDRVQQTVRGGGRLAHAFLGFSYMPASVRQMIATGDDEAAFHGFCGAESGSVPVSAISPSVLVANIEVEKTSKEQDRPPLLPPPAHDKKGG